MQDRTCALGWAACPKRLEQASVHLGALRQGAARLAQRTACEACRVAQQAVNVGAHVVPSRRLNTNTSWLWDTVFVPHVYHTLSVYPSAWQGGRRPGAAHSWSDRQRGGALPQGQQHE